MEATEYLTKGEERALARDHLENELAALTAQITAATARWLELALRDERPRLVVHVDAQALAADRPGRSELEEGPAISAETARRLGCDAETVSGSSARACPSASAASAGRCRTRSAACSRHETRAAAASPAASGAATSRAHHRRHRAKGGETSLDNLVFLCFHDHRLLHEGGYRIEEGEAGELRFRNRSGVYVPSVPRSPRAEALVHQNQHVEITAKTNRNGLGDRMDLGYAVDAVLSVMRSR